MGLYVQFGCGLSCPEGWVNFDGSPRLRLEQNPLSGALFKATGKTLFPGTIRYAEKLTN